MTARRSADVAVIGGGPAGAAAAVWAARYRRRVAMFDSGQHRNRWTQQTHGYLGFEGASPKDLLRQTRDSLRRYAEVDVHDGVAVSSIVTEPDGPFLLRADDGTELLARRVVLATGVRDVFPDVVGFEELYGTSVFTCPSCDGYEAQGKQVAVFGADDSIMSFALGLLDWAATVHLVVPQDDHADRADDMEALRRNGIVIRSGTPRRMVGSGGMLTSIEMSDGSEVPADVAFCMMRHEQHSELPRLLGCRINDDGTIEVDGDGRTSVPHVYAAGDMTPGPHLVQIAAAQGAKAGIAAAVSLRGEPASWRSPTPAPDPAIVLHR